MLLCSRCLARDKDQNTLSMCCHMSVHLGCGYDCLLYVLKLVFAVLHFVYVQEQERLPMSVVLSEARITQPHPKQNYSF